ncbi:MAG: DNA alkylation repair protein [Bacteroidales bacterium]|nr:MAG: DNA alkylation repair protein [Bacteroidales bacterium]
MTIKEVWTLLEQNKDERGITHWKRTGIHTMESYGIGLTKLKNLGKRIGKDHSLALELWKTNNYDAKTLSIIIDDPAKITREQVNDQIGDLEFWMLSHSYCSILLPKVPFMKELSEEWMHNPDPLRRKCGYLLLYQIAKDNKTLENPFFEEYLKIIRDSLQSEENFVKDAMNNALLMIGQRNKYLNEKALDVAKSIGEVVVDYGDNSCQAANCITHLSSERIRKKVGLI